MQISFPQSLLCIHSHTEGTRFIQKEFFDQCELVFMKKKILHQNTSLLLFIFSHMGTSSIFISIFLLFVIHCPSLVLFLDHEHDWEDREAAEGKDIAEPLDSNVRDCEDAQENDADDVIPGGKQNLVLSIYVVRVLKGEAKTNKQNN